VLAGVKAQGGFFKHAMHLAQQHTRSLQAQPLDAAETAKFTASVETSLRQQRELEATDQGSFEDFVARYYA
jgi:glutamate--cysteine ligase